MVDAQIAPRKSVTEGNCATCGRHFAGARSGQAPRKFCSLRCAYEGRSSGKEARERTLAASTRTCAYCGTPFTPVSQRQKYCAQGCKRRVDAERATADYLNRELTCAHCGKQYARHEGQRKYCSDDCRKAANARQGAHYNRGTVQAEEHVARRVASVRATLAETVRVCVRCGSAYTPTAAAQKYCSGQCWNAAARTRRKPKNRPEITKAEFDRLLAEQNGLCGICRQENGSGHRLAADHDHSTGRIRGLLCHRCNTAIGLLRDDPALLQAAIGYLNTHK